MRGKITVLGVIRFCLFYIGIVPKCKYVSTNQKSSFLREGDGMCCEKCDTIMTYYPGVVITHATHPNASTVGHRLPRALGGINERGWIQHECKLCNGAHGNVLAELIHKYGNDVHDVPFFLLVKFVIYSIGEFNDLVSDFFTEFESEYQRHLLNLRNKAEAERIAVEKQSREVRRRSLAKAIIEESRKKALAPLEDAVKSQGKRE